MNVTSFHVSGVAMVLSVLLSSELGLERIVSQSIFDDTPFSLRHRAPATHIFE